MKSYSAGARVDRIALIGFGEETRGAKRLPSLLSAAIAIGARLFCMIYAQIDGFEEIRVPKGLKVCW
ncbi:hypothetical protein Hanom_Chr16g01470741 [Helianthus anomalus]